MNFLRNKVPPRRAAGFTLLEIMVAIFIFSMVLTAIYSIWVGILRGKKAVETTLAEVQRSRISMHAMEDAFLTTLMFSDNPQYYAFQADTTGEDAYVSMVSRLPASYPGVGRFAGGELVVRRISFYTEPDPKGGKQLVMSQAPMLAATNQAGSEPYTLVLAREVSKFTLEFWDLEKNEWATEWLSTNQLPRLVRITLGLGKTHGYSYSAGSHDIVSRMVEIPAAAAQSRAMPGRPGFPPGFGQPGTIQPSQGLRSAPRFQN